MLHLILDSLSLNNSIMFIVLISFFVTIFSLTAFNKFLPRDVGRKFALNGELSKGKPRGAGIIFILVYLLIVLLVIPFSIEFLLYCLLLFLAMLGGFLDDKSKRPWSEYKKGSIDLLISIISAVIFTYFNPDYVGFFLGSDFISIPKILFVVFATLLIWVSINVTNCSDGVDGLSGSLIVISLITVYIIIINKNQIIEHSILIMIACVMAYLWFNISPSKILMGDAGSRALGYYIAISVLKTYNPFIFLLVAFMLIIDGGIGLIKITIIRVLKKNPLKKIITPIHDHMRKANNWSDSQVVFRFMVIQILASVIAILI